MTRTNRSPSAGSTIVNTLRPYEGGTGQTTVAAARTALNLVAATDLNQPNGVGGLGVDGKIQASQMPDNGPAPFGVQGATSVVIGTSTNFSITNYDIFTTYTLTAISGSVDRSGDTISYSAPSTPGAGGFILNGRQVNITVTDYLPNTPTLAAIDVAGSTGKAAFQCTGNAFAMSSGTATHASSDWQVASDSAFNTIISQSSADAVNKVSWKSGDLNVSTTYYARVRYRSSTGGVSNWSNTVSITTKASYLIATEEAILAATGGAYGDSMGISVSISSDGTRVVAGASYYAFGNSASGAAYIFLRTGTTWAQEAKLTPTTITNANFGQSASISSDGTRVVVGAYQDTTTSSQAGAAYVYSRSGTTWTLEQKLIASDTGSGLGFGNSASMTADGTRIVIGSLTAAGGAVSSAGAAYVFLRTGTTWAQEAKIISGTPVNGANFGDSVSISGDGTRLISGESTGTSAGVANSGIAYVFVRSGSTWTLEQTLTASDKVAQNRFGKSVAMNNDGTRVIVGAYQASTNIGAAYVYLRTNTTWTQEAKLQPPALGNSANFGISCAMNANGDRLIVGASRDSYLTTATTGASFIYSRSGTTWTQESKVGASNAAVGYLFGSAVAMTTDGSRVANGAYQATGGSANTGAVYIDR